MARFDTHHAKSGGVHRIDQPRHHRACLNAVLRGRSRTDLNRLRRTPEPGCNRHNRRPLRGVPGCERHHEPNRAVANLRQIRRCRLPARGPSLSKIWACDKPAAVQSQAGRVSTFPPVVLPSRIRAVHRLLPPFLPRLKRPHGFVSSFLWTDDPGAGHCVYPQRGVRTSFSSTECVYF